MKRKRQPPLEVAREHVTQNKDREGCFEVKQTENKGRGVFATRKILSGEFLVQYAGELITASEGEKREIMKTSVFRYFFTHKGASLCIDATSEPPEGVGTAILGRLVNHGEPCEVNAKVKVVEVGTDGTPALCLFALKDMDAGEELLYDYGVKNLPWKIQTNQEGSTSTELPSDGSHTNYEGSTSTEPSDGPYIGRWTEDVLFVKHAKNSRQIGSNILYHKKRKIASGSDGSQVFVGIRNSEQPVAIKRVNSDFVKKEKEIAKILEGKSFTHVLPLICYEEDEDFTYFICNLCEYNLQEVIENRNCPLHSVLTESKRQQMCLEFLKGLKELHDAGILHRDLKPTNVLIDVTGKVLISDFGVSRHSICQKTTNVTAAVGTLCWMSKEVFEGSLAYRRSSDIQMAGFVMYYILSGGHLPHESVYPFIKDPAGAMKNIQDNKFSLHHLGPCHQAYAHLLQEMINPDPHSRPDVESCISKFIEPIDNQAAQNLLQGILRGEVTNEEESDDGSSINCEDNSADEDWTPDVAELDVDEVQSSRNVTTAVVDDDRVSEDDYEGRVDQLGDLSSANSPGKKRKAVIDSDDEDEEGSLDELGDSQAQKRSKKRNVAAALHNDSDDDDDDGRVEQLGDEQTSTSSRGKKKIVKGSDGEDEEVSLEESGNRQKQKRSKVAVVVHDDSDSEDDYEGMVDQLDNEQRANSSGKTKNIEDEGNIDDSGEKQTEKICKCGRLKSGSSSNTQHDPFVASSKRAAGCCRIWDKYSYCLYCSEKQTKLIRHLRRQHSGEVLVAKAMSMEEGKSCLSSGSSQIWSKLRNHGNHEHNKKVHLGEADDLIVKKRPEQRLERSITDYTPCSDCLGYFSSQSLWKHKQTCKERTNIKKGGRHVKEGRSLLPLKHDVSEHLRNVLERMVHDNITLIAKTDKNILAVGEKELETSNSFKKEEVAREKMRTLGKVLNIGRSINNKIVSGEDLVKPSSFDTMVQVARVMSGYNAKTQKHDSYSNAGRVGFALKDLALVIRSRFIKLGLRERSLEVDEFLKLRDSDWTKVTSSARRQGDEERFRKPQILPLTEDCVNFHKFLTAEETRIKTEVSKEGKLSAQLCIPLAETTLAQIIFFNRRRPREVESLEISDYLKQIKEKRPIEEEIKQSLSISEKVAIDRLTLLMVRGKRGRGVPILLTKSMKESVDMLTDFHQQRDEDAKYVFSRLTDEALTPLRGYFIVRKLAEKAGLKEPDNIRCTKLRKQIATLSQLLGLKDNELEQLASHMGHNIHVHREYYRLPQETILLAKMSKLLCVVERGELHLNKGKSLEEIEVTPNDQVDFVENELATESDDDEEAAHNLIPSEDNEVAKETLVGRQYKKWSKAQEKFLFSQAEIKKLTRQKKVPGKTTADLVLKRSKGLLSDKTWKDVKNKVHNHNTTAKDKLKRKEAALLKRPKKKRKRTKQRYFSDNGSK